MSKQLRYRGEFLSRAGVVWRVDILQESETAYSVGQLTFEAEEALVIDWKHTDKEEVICGSEATIKIESPTDRAYEDLYTIEPGNIRMDVYRGGALYWSGALDPEFYEEPYEKEKYYVVTLTFSDFGILDRLKYNLSGMQTLQGILTDALTRSTILYNSLDADTYCTTYFEGGATKANLAGLSIRSENFYDEDGEPSTLKETLEGILQPLALRMIQRNGKIFIYDLNGLHTIAQSRAITWDGESQTMAVDKVANNVKINFSPYSSAELLTGEIEYGGEYSEEMVNLSAAPGASYYSYYPDYSDEHRQGDTYYDYNLINFTIFLSSQGSGLSYLNPLCRYCHILPLVGGASEADAVAWGFYSGGHRELTSGYPKQILNAACKPTNIEIMRTNRVFLPKISTQEANRYYLRLTLEMLLDARYNPYTGGTEEGNEEPNFDIIKEFSAWVFVPIGITMYDASGNAICHYVNSPIARSAAVGHLGYAKGAWVSGAASFGDAWLEYYDASEDLEHNAGVQGWKANRHCIGRPDNEARRSSYCGSYVMPSIFDSFKKMADGEYIPYPTQGGYLEITVYAGINGYDYAEGAKAITPVHTDDTLAWDEQGVYNKIRWMLYKAPKVELVKNNLTFNAAELEDIEYSGYINRAAKEEISLDTICGTSEKACPTARGIYCKTSDSLQIIRLKRANITDHPEKLLIGTLYSQYAGRKTTLAGRAEIDTGDLCKFTEQNQTGKVFMMSGERQDVITDTSEVQITEFSADEYTAIEEV